MDDFTLLDGVDRPRALPAQLRSRLEGVLSSDSEPEATFLRNLDNPRALPPHLRKRLMRTMVRRPPWSLPTVTTLTGAAAAVILLVSATALILSASRQSRDVSPRQSPAPLALSSPEPDEPLPSPSAPGQVQPSVVERSAPRGKSTKGAPAAARYGPPSPRSEVCFPEERCPVIAASDANRPGGPAYAPPPPAVPPGKPRDVRAQTGPSLGEITISWEPPSEQGSSSIRKYALYRMRENDPQMTTVVILDASVRSYVDTGLALGTYTYKLRVRNYDGISDYSDGSSAVAISAS